MAEKKKPDLTSEVKKVYQKAKVGSQKGYSGLAGKYGETTSDAFHAGNAKRKTQETLKKKYPMGSMDLYGTIENVSEKSRRREAKMAALAKRSSGKK